MRVINDRDEKSESTQVDFFAVVAHSLLCAIGLTTIIFGPLALLSTYPRAPEPWPKVSALAGAVIALLLFQAPPMQIAVLFVFGMVVADSIWREVELPKLLAMSVLLAGVLGVGALALSAQMNQMSFDAFCTDLLNTMVSQTEVVRKGLSIDDATDPALAKAFFKIEGPFLYLSGMLLSLWLGAGIAAHFSWFPKDHLYSATSLRKIRFPNWAGAVFIVMFVGNMVLNLFLGSERIFWFDGLVSFLGTFMIIQGTIFLSQLFESRAVSNGQRTVIYSLVLLPGFYLVLLVGAIAPWLRRRNKNLEGVQ